MFDDDSHMNLRSDTKTSFKCVSYTLPLKTDSKMTKSNFARFAVLVVATNLLAACVTLVAVVSLYQRYHAPTNVVRATQECCKCFDPNLGTQFYCPSFGASFDIFASGGVEIRNSDPNSLCTVTEITSDSSLKPLARSYNAMNWEASAGANAGLQFLCDKGSCFVNLPVLPAGSRYQITTFKAPSYTVDDQVARFLEQATFGPTLYDIASLNQYPMLLQLSFASWINSQKTVPMTSHREYYRRRMNSRFDLATQMGAVTHPCQAGTRYRRFAFGSKDLNKILTIQTVGSYAKLSVDGFVRTVVKAPVVALTGGAVLPDGR